MLKFQEHVDQFVGRLLHQRALRVEDLGLFYAQVLSTHVGTSQCQRPNPAVQFWLACFFFFSFVHLLHYLFILLLLLLLIFSFVL